MTMTPSQRAKAAQEKADAIANDLSKARLVVAELELQWKKANREDIEAFEELRKSAMRPAMTAEQHNAYPKGRY